MRGKGKVQCVVKVPVEDDSDDSGCRRQTRDLYFLIFAQRERGREHSSSEMASTASAKQKNKPRKGRPVSNAPLSHPPLQGSSFNTSLSAFSPLADLFAIVSLAVDKHRLRVHDIDTGRSISEYVVDSGRVTALSWATFPSPKPVSKDQETEDAAPRKKRKKRDSRAHESVSGPDAIPVVVLGLSTGSVIIFSPSHARVIRTLSDPSSASSILSLDVNADAPGAALFILTSCVDGVIRTWNAQTGELLSSSKTDGHLPGTSLSLRPGIESDHPSFLLAHHSIRLLSVSSDSLLTSPQKLTEEARFIGHASNISMLRWQPSDDSQSPRRFASVAESDRHVHLWEMPRVSGSEGKLVVTAPLDSDARHISFSQSHTHPTLLALSASGRIAIFTPTNDQAATSAAKKTKEKVAILLPRSSATISFKRGLTAPQVINAAFDQDGQIRVAWLAGGVRPVFDVVVSCLARMRVCQLDMTTCTSAISGRFRSLHSRCQYCTRGR